jgi:hypothetical protein
MPHSLQHDSKSSVETCLLTAALEAMQILSDMVSTADIAQHDPQFP